MLLHTVKVYPSKINLPKSKQLAWKIAEIASDNARLNRDAIEMVKRGIEKVERKRGESVNFLPFARASENNQRDRENVVVELRRSFTSYTKRRRWVRQMRL